MSGSISPATYELDAETQAEIISCMMWDSDFLRRTDGLIKPEYFENELDAGFASIALKFYQRYKEAPSATAWVELIKDAFAAKPPLWRNDLRVDVVNRLKSTMTSSVRSRGFLLDKIEEFAQQQETMAALYDSVNYVGKLSDPDRFKRVSERMQQAQKIGLATGDDDYDYFERIEERTQERLDILAGGKPKTGITTGIPELDELLITHGGWGRGELSLFMGAMKSGKSFNLISCAAAAVLDKKNVLLITLENAKEVQARRLDAYISNIAMSQFATNIHTVSNTVDSVGKRGDVGILKIREFPTGTFKPRDLERVLEEYQVKGIYFDIIIIDYLDIMAPDTHKDSERDASKEIYTRIRAIAGTYRGPNGKAAMLSATQTNREGAKAAVAHATHVSEDINKVRIADLVISINRTDEEKAANKARLHITLARNEQDGITLFVTQNLDMAKAVETVTSVE